MKRSKFTDHLIAFILQQSEGGTPVAEVCRKAGISDTRAFTQSEHYLRLPCLCGRYQSSSQTICCRKEPIQLALLSGEG